MSLLLISVKSTYITIVIYKNPILLSEKLNYSTTTAAKILIFLIIFGEI